MEWKMMMVSSRSHRKMRYSSREDRAVSEDSSEKTHDSPIRRSPPGRCWGAASSRSSCSSLWLFLASFCERARPDLCLQQGAPRPPARSPAETHLRMTRKAERRSGRR